MPGEVADTSPTEPTKLADPDLSRIVDAWPELAEPIRRAMLAILEAAEERR